MNYIDGASCEAFYTESLKNPALVDQIEIYEDGKSCYFLTGLEDWITEGEDMEQNEVFKSVYVSRMVFDSIVKGIEDRDIKINYQICPMQKAEEMLYILKDYNPSVYTEKCKGYEWLGDEDSRCVVISSPHYEAGVRVILENGEITLGFAGGHIHYGGYQEDFESAVDEVLGILKGRICAVQLFDLNGRWYGDAFMETENSALDVMEIFSNVFSIKEFYNKLMRRGYEARFYFWNSENNKTVRLESSAKY